MKEQIDLEELSDELTLLRKCKARLEEDLYEINNRIIEILEEVEELI